MQISMRPAHAALRSGQARPVCMPAAARPALRLATPHQQRMAFQASLEPSAQVHRGVTAHAAASSSASSSWPSAEKEQPRSWLATLSAHIARAAMLAGLVFAVSLTMAGNALASRTGGRAGGSSGFSARSAASYSRSSSYGSRSLPHTSHTTIVHTGPSWGFGWGMPSLFFPITPFGYGYHSSGSSALVTLMLFAVVCIIAVQAFRMMRPNRSSDAYDEEEGEDMPVTVAKVQVGLLAAADSIKSDLNLLAAQADTSSPAGLHLLLQETVVALLRNPSYCVYGNSSSKVVREAEQAERMFNSMTMEERSKVDQETLVNIAGMSRSKSMVIDPKAPAELVVVNLMVAVEGDLQLPAIRSLSDLKLAMSKLGSVSANDVLAVEVFWTPQADGDVLTQQECLLKYPTLVPL